MFYGGARIDYPAGTDTAIFAPDDSVTFLRLAPDYLRYDPEPQNARVWGVFTDRKRFPRPDSDAFDAAKLDARGLLPAWARFATSGPPNAVTTMPSTARGR
jgi:hypothetical protein